MLVQHTENQRENHFPLTENTCPDWNESEHLGERRASVSKCAHVHTCSVCKQNLCKWNINELKPRKVKLQT